MKKVIERLEACLAYADGLNPWVRLYFDRVRFPDGREGRYNRVVVSDGRSGVVVLPWRDGMVGLVRQYRYPVAQYLWELPRGFGESSDSAGDAARELFEELGVVADELIDLGRLYPDSGLIETEVRVFLARCPPLGPSAAPESPGGEIAERRWLGLNGVMSEIADGRINDAYTLGALMMALARGILPLAP